MAEERQISVVTSTRTESGGTIIFIKSAYFSDVLPNTIYAFLADEVNSQDGTSYVEGELLIQMKNHPENIDYAINSNGELIVYSNTGDTNNYSINDNGYLYWDGENGA